MDLIILEIVIALGAAVQGTIGFGSLLVAAPVMALLFPGSVPAASLLVALPITIGMVVREHEHIDTPVVGRVLLGLLPGTAIGALVVRAVDPRDLTVWIGLAIIVAALAASRRRAPSIRPVVSFGAGLISGVINTISGTGGPPVALLYRDRPGPQVRSTLGVIFLCSGLLSLGSVAAGGALGASQVWLAVKLLPGVGVGMVVSRFAIGRVSDAALRVGVLTFSIAAGTAAVARGLAGW